MYILHSICTYSLHSNCQFMCRNTWTLVAQFVWVRYNNFKGVSSWKTKKIWRMNFCEKNLCGRHMHRLLFLKALWQNTQYYPFKSYLKIPHSTMCVCLHQQHLFLFQNIFKKGEIFTFFLLYMVWQQWEGECIVPSSQEHQMLPAQHQWLTSLRCEHTHGTFREAPLEHLVSLIPLSISLTNI